MMGEELEAMEEELEEGPKSIHTPTRLSLYMYMIHVLHLLCKGNLSIGPRRQAAAAAAAACVGEPRLNGRSFDLESCLPFL
jgi:hypothetical protein